MLKLFTDTTGKPCFACAAIAHDEHAIKGDWRIGKRHRQLRGLCADAGFA
ncbi:hypothetical protein [Rhizobium leguminosarum]|nr:hypothetical protein [Rhizobium leguminosarum]